MSNLIIKEEALTPRQLEVARLMIQGMSVAEMADRLMMARHEVKKHCRNILSRGGLIVRPPGLPDTFSTADTPADRCR